jgi:hypothetical protein
MCSTMGKDEGATAKRMWIARRDRVAGAAGVRGVTATAKVKRQTFGENRMCRGESKC